MMEDHGIGDMIKIPQKTSDSVQDECLADLAEPYSSVP